jgi:thiol:disulfide interchange protein
VTRRSLFPAFLLLLAGTLAAEKVSERPHVEAHLVADVLSVAPGAAFRAGVRLIHEAGWHTYYKEPGDSGMATRVDWDLPKGFSAGPIEWPPFRKHVEPPLTTNVYEGAVTLASAVTVPDAPSGPVVLRAKVTWLECAEICLPGKADLSLTLPVEKTARPHPDAAALFASTPPPEGPAAPAGSLWLSVALAFLGGMLLNLMPCVLPVLSLKVLSLIKGAGGSPAAARRHGLLYSAGVLASFWALAGLLLALRAAGHGLGWGFQLQSPVFVGMLAALFLVLALNLFGLFEIGASLTRFGGGSAGAFGSGVLAVVAATPCTAPFMGAALGYAVSRPAPEAFAVFTSLGLGMAWPYAALTASPRLMALVPKPGPWMLWLKKVLGVLLLGTALWLGWVLARQTGLARSAEGGLAWEPFSEERVVELRKAGRPVFVDFTADWCLTCKVNEGTALRDPAVLARFKELNVAPLKADWTNNDPAVTRALAAQGRSSVPLYVFHPADPSAAPRVLPTLLTRGILLEALQNADKE